MTQGVIIPLDLVTPHERSHSGSAMRPIRRIRGPNAGRQVASSHRLVSLASCQRDTRPTAWHEASEVYNSILTETSTTIAPLYGFVFWGTAAQKTAPPLQTREMERSL